MKKLVSLLMALCMLATLVVVSASAEEPTVITWLEPTYSAGSLETPFDALWLKEIQERLNIKLEFVPLNSGDSYNSDSYTNVVNLTLAGGDLPDIMYWNWSKYSGGVVAAIEDGVVLPISSNPDYVALLPNFMGMVENNEMVRQQLTLADGTISTFCHIEESAQRNAYHGYGIREDWLERVGKTVPTTVDELYDVLCAFRDQDANGNGDPSDEVPMFCNGTDLLYQLIGMYDMTQEGGMQLDPDTGKVTYWAAMNDGKNFRDAVLTLRKWYAEGLINADFASTTSEIENSYVRGDKAGMFVMNTGDYKKLPVFLKGDEATGVAPSATEPEKVKLAPMNRIESVYHPGKHYTTIQKVKNWCGANEANVITTAAKDHGVVEKILQMFDFMYSPEGNDVIAWGVQGVSYDVDENGNKYILDSVDDIMNYALPTRGCWPRLMNLSAWMYNDCSTEDGINALNMNWEADKDLIIANLTLSGDEAEEYTTLFSDIDTAAKETFLTVILGEKDESALDELQNNLKSMKVDRAIEIYQNFYDMVYGK